MVEENTVKIEVEMGLTIEHEEIYSENGSLSKGGRFVEVNCFGTTKG